MSRWGLIRAVVYVCLWTVSLLSTNLVAEADETWLSPGRENDSSSPPLSHEKRLMDSLLRHYDASVRPVKNSSEPVIIRLGITLTQIFDLDEKNQVLTTIVWLDQEWFDEYLVWDPLEFGNFSNLRLPCHKIWLPDIVLYNKHAP